MEDVLEAFEDLAMATRTTDPTPQESCNSIHKIYQLKRQTPKLTYVLKFLEDKKVQDSLKWGAVTIGGVVRGCCSLSPCGYPCCYSRGQCGYWKYCGGSWKYCCRERCCCWRCHCCSHFRIDHRRCGSRLIWNCWRDNRWEHHRYYNFIRGESRI
ncbi:hypothetical protein H4I96_07805 [Botrytis cinerea]